MPGSRSELCAFPKPDDRLKKLVPFQMCRVTQRAYAAEPVWRRVLNLFQHMSLRYDSTEPPIVIGFPDFRHIGNSKCRCIDTSGTDGRYIGNEMSSLWEQIIDLSGTWMTSELTVNRRVASQGRVV